MTYNIHKVGMYVRSDTVGCGSTKPYIYKVLILYSSDTSHTVEFSGYEKSGGSCISPLLFSFSRSLSDSDSRGLLNLITADPCNTGSAYAPTNMCLYDCIGSTCYVTEVLALTSVSSPTAPSTVTVTKPSCGSLKFVWNAGSYAFCYYISLYKYVNNQWVLVTGGFLPETDNSADRTITFTNLDAVNHEFTIKSVNHNRDFSSGKYEYETPDSCCSSLSCTLTVS